MKEKLFLLAAFIALNVAAQSSLASTGDLYTAYTPVKTSKIATKKASISLQIDVKKEILKVRSTHPVAT